VFTSTGPRTPEIGLFEVHFTRALVGSPVTEDYLDRPLLIFHTLAYSNYITKLLAVHLGTAALRDRTQHLNYPGPIHLLCES
jgi:hypothetical protein